MDSKASAPSLIDLINQAIARELQVSIQYMFQHSLGTAVSVQMQADALAARQSKFVGSHSSIWLPGTTLRKIAITEMRHAEAMAERVSQLGAEPTTQPAPITLGHTPTDMLRIDQAEERSAVALYRQIVEAAAQEGDRVTESMFRRILADEEKHLRTFSGLLGQAGAGPVPAA